MRRKSDKSKLTEGRGTGTGANYKPWIEVGEFDSEGTAVSVNNWKNGRRVHCMSKGEFYFWLLLMWDDDNLDIREQYPLEIDKTIKIANNQEFIHPQYKGVPVIMTTDFLVTKKNRLVAYSVKQSRESVLSNSRVLGKLQIEQLYWLSKSVEWKLIFADELNIVKAQNIFFVSQFYNGNWPDDLGFFKFLIARKLIKINMDEPINNFRQMFEEHRKEIEKWMTSDAVLKIS